MNGLRNMLASVATAALLVGGCAGDRQTARVPAIEKVDVASVPGDRAALRVTATGSVPTTGWGGAILRPLHDPTHPPGVAAFELVAVPPTPGAVVTLGERTLTASAIATLPPGTRWVNVLGAVNDETRDVPGARVTRVRTETRKPRQIYVHAGKD